MNRRLIKRVINAMESQGRLILHLVCGHNQSVTLRDLAARKMADRDFQPGQWFPCPDCPDPPPEEEKPLDPMEAFYRASSGEEQ